MLVSTFSGFAPKCEEIKPSETVAQCTPDRDVSRATLAGLHFDVRLFDQFPKPFEFQAIELAEFFGADVARLTPQTFQLRLHIRKLDDACQFGF